MANNGKGLNPLATGVAGAVIGAAAAAAAVVLADEKNRKKAEKVLEDLQKEGSRIIKEISKKALELKDAVKKTKEPKEPKKIKAKKK